MKKNKGITLIALVITIIVLLILAGVTIATLTGDNVLLQKTTSAKEEALDAEIEEEIRLAWNKVYTEKYLDKTTNTAIALKAELDKTGHTDSNTTVTANATTIIIEGYRGKDKLIDISTGIVKEPSAVAKAKIVEYFDDNTSITDEYGNSFIVPKGFRIASDSAEVVTEGIVIEDATYTNTIGSQFVWIPVSKDNTEANKIKGIKNTTILLGRYTFKTSGDDEGTISESKIDGSPISVRFPWATYNFKKKKKSNTGNGANGNAIAKDIDDFKSKTIDAGGFWIGRYEARKSSTNILTERVTDNIYNNITQPDAALKASQMYDTNNYFESDLINSYAWDTATLFLQEYDNRKYNSNTVSNYKSKYSMQGSLYFGASPSLTGTTIDKICNVYDMASNCLEWTTETCTISGSPCVDRGGHHNESSSYNYTSFRYGQDKSTTGDYFSFRCILYINKK